jgi:dienelactone hydrolase
MIAKMISLIAAIAAFAATAGAAEEFDPYGLPYQNPDLKFPEQPQPFAPGREIKMFKPDGSGPFPALVIMPGCYGQTYSMHTFDWAKRALDHGYAAIVVDPLDPRGVTNNCVIPRPVPPSRLLKDAFDAANHLRRQSFVDPSRIGLMGFSLGAMVGLGASGPPYSHLNGSEPFRAIVSAYPSCINIETTFTSGKVDVHYAPDKVIVPLLIEIGDKDKEGEQELMNGCKALGDEQKALGAPVEYVIYHATHAWDKRELTAADGPAYIYNADVTEQSAKDAFSFLDAHLKP